MRPSLFLTILITCYFIVLAQPRPTLREEHLLHLLECVPYPEKVNDAERLLLRSLKSIPTYWQYLDGEITIASMIKAAEGCGEKVHFDSPAWQEYLQLLADLSHTVACLELKVLGPINVCRQAIAGFYGRMPKRVSRQALQGLRERVCFQQALTSDFKGSTVDEGGKLFWESEEDRLRCANEGIRLLLRSSKTRSEKKARPAAQPDDRQADQAGKEEQQDQGIGLNERQNRPNNEFSLTDAKPWGADLLNRLGAAIHKVPKPLFGPWNTVGGGFQSLSVP
ncbi:MAG: hypothetical protein M1816_004097 [Peltula sp. TS41687]|nr:MAG: hypothetical protein M1816_004097 [Peltula sp. TS41687]